MSVTHSKESDFLNRLTEITEANLSNEQFGVSELASEMGMSRSNLHRKLKSIAAISISQFIRRVRLERAMEMLQETSSTISEVAFECGFHSVSYFTKCFHDHYGYTPGRAGNSEPEKNNLDGAQHHDTKPGIKKKQLTTIILSSALFVIGAVFVLFFIFKPFNSRQESLDKSIAVLPFKYLSDEPDKQYLADGTMEAILLHLSKIEDLRVLARTSVEQYRETDKTASEICQELDVAYVLEGSFQKYGDQARLIVQLIQPGREGHAWGKEYDRNWKDIFTVQSEVARLVARELQAVITPEEKQLIEKIPTTNLTAYDFFQKGIEEHQSHLLDRNNIRALERAEVLYHKALEYDSTYTEVYGGLALLNFHKHQYNGSENNLDSTLIYADIALSYDYQNANAHVTKGWYNLALNRIIQANEEFDKALRYDPNNGWSYSGKGWMYWAENNLIEAIDNFLKVLIYERGPTMNRILISIGQVYAYAGFNEKSQYYFKEALKLDDDSIGYYIDNATSEFFNGNFSKTIDILLKGYSIDSLHTGILISLGVGYMFNVQIEESLKYFKKYIERQNVLGQYIYNRVSVFNISTNAMSSNIGYSFWKRGYKQEAEHYFDEQLKLSEENISKTNNLWDFDLAIYSLARVHAFRGEKDKAYENLRNFNQKPRMASWASTLFKYDPLFNSIRDEPEFQQILHDVEAKYEAEHERVRQWLEENDML